MKNYFLIAIFSILLFSCKKSVESKIKKNETDLPVKYQELVDNETIYGLINSEVLRENKIFNFCENVLNRKTAYYIGEDTVLLKKVDTLFSQKDKEFISKQYRNSISFILNPKLLKHKKIIEYDTTSNVSREKSRKYWDKLIENNHCIGLIDLPLFNLKKDMAIVHVGYNCGLMCAEGGTYIYKLNSNGKWELYLTVEKWIS
ncbi:MAG: hypothetical protein DCF13_13285 [Flavobacteriaceae bacterium]|nr:MAG: hypothetical protein DCF13_13285 [Flavobacteriaceae bacterium]